MGSYVKKYQVCSRATRVWAKLSLQESAKLIHMVLTVLCARSSCREAVAREKRSKKQNDRIGHLVNLKKFWSIWFEDGCLICKIDFWRWLSYLQNRFLKMAVLFSKQIFEDGCLIFKADFWRWLSYFQNRTGAHSKWEKRQSDRRARNNTQSIAEQLYSRVTLKNNLTK